MTPTPNPRIVYAWPYGSLGGSQIYLLKIATAIRPAFDITAVMPSATSPALARYWADIGGRVVFMDAAVDERAQVKGLDRIRRRLRQWQVERALWRAIRPVAPPGAILHLDLAPWTSFWLVSFLARSRPVVLTLHTRMPRPGAIRRFAWQVKLSVLVRHRKVRLMAANRHVRDSLRGFLSAAAVDRIPVAYSAVDLAEIDGIGERAAEPVTRVRTLHVVTVGQFIDRKGPWELLQAVRDLPPAHRQVRFKWLCPSPPTLAQQRRIAGFGLGEQFEWTALDRPEDTRRSLLRAVREADLFVLPSLEEGLPLALVEAMALGVPCLATRTNGVPEAITDGVDGVLVEPGDVTGLTAALDALLGDAERRRRLGRAGRLTARDRFSSRATARVAAAIYGELLGGRPTSGR